VVHKEQLELYVPVWSADPLNPPLQLAKITISPNGGALWYAPAVLLGAVGLAAWGRRGERRATAGVLASVGIFVGFLCLMTIAKGDPSWGPRYLTPVFAVLWLFAPVGASLLWSRLVGALLAAGLVVQLLALSVDHHRLYVKLQAPSGFEAYYPRAYFHLGHAHLFTRPREIVEVATNRERAPEYSPAPTPTFTFPIITVPHIPVTGPEAIQRYHVLNSFRPWWASMPYLSESERPVPLVSTATWLAVIAAAGLLLTIPVLGGRVGERPPEVDHASPA
jgi:hypothetical protein